MDMQREWDYRFGVIACNIVNVAPKKNPKSFRPGDFFPSLKTNPFEEVAEEPEEEKFNRFIQSVEAVTKKA